MATKPKVVKLKDLLSSQIQQSLIDFDNGTYGKSYIGKITNITSLYDPEREKARVAYFKARINKDPNLEKLEKEFKSFEVISEFEFTLEEKIPLVTGSSSKIIAGVKRSLQAENVTKIYLRETMQDKILLEDIGKDRLRLTLTDAILEVKAANTVNPVTVYVTDIAAKDFAALKMVERNMAKEYIANADYK